MGKKKKLGFYDQNEEGKKKIIQKLELADFLTNTAKLLMQGQFPGSHARLIVDHVTVLEAMAKAEREKAGKLDETVEPDGDCEEPTTEDVKEENEDGIRQELYETEAGEA